MKAFVHSLFFFSGTHSLHVSGHDVPTANILPEAKPSPPNSFYLLVFYKQGPGPDNYLILTLKITTAWKKDRKYWE